MKQLTALIAIVLLFGCGTRPPLPPECEGPWHPINIPAQAKEAGHGP